MSSKQLKKWSVLENGFSNSYKRLATKEKATDFKVAVLNGGRAETRTLGPLIKSQLLYQLSYAPHRSDIKYNRIMPKCQYFFKERA